MKTDKIPVPGTAFENNLKERLINSSLEDLERQRMVREQLECRGIRSRMVLDALAKVPRHLFVPADIRHLAYTDHALLTYCGQTISQPFIVAKMTEMLSLEPNHRVLEIGTGTGVQTVYLPHWPARFINGTHQRTSRPSPRELKSVSLFKHSLSVWKWLQRLPRCRSISCHYRNSRPAFHSAKPYRPACSGWTNGNSCWHRLPDSVSGY